MFHALNIPALQGCCACTWTVPSADGALNVVQRYAILIEEQISMSF